MQTKKKLRIQITNLQKEVAELKQRLAVYNDHTDHKEHLFTFDLAEHVLAQANKVEVKLTPKDLNNLTYLTLQATTQENAQFKDFNYEASPFKMSLDGPINEAIEKKYTVDDDGYITDKGRSYDNFELANRPIDQLLRNYNPINADYALKHEPFYIKYYTTVADRTFKPKIYDYNDVVNGTGVDTLVPTIEAQ